MPEIFHDGFYLWSVLTKILADTRCANSSDDFLIALLMEATS